MKISISKLPLDSSDDLLINGHLAIPCILKLNQQTIYSSALIDSGASGYGFIDHSYVHKHNISMILLNTPWTLKAFDKKPTEYG